MESDPQSSQHAWLGSIGVMLAGGASWLFNRLKNHPRPPNLSDKDREAIRRDFEKMIAPIIEQINDISADMQGVRGEIGQMNQQIERNAGELRGLIRRFNISGTQ